MIYFMQHVETGRIKIGCSINVIHRLRDMARYHGAIALLGTMDGDISTEKRLHIHFADFNVRCAPLWGWEWFTPGQPIMDFIAANTALTDNSFDMEFACWYAIGGGRRFTSNVPSLLLVKYGVESADLLPHRNIIAKEIGIDPQVMYDWTRKSYIRRPIPGTLQRMCAFLNCTIADLLQYVPDQGEREAV